MRGLSKQEWIILATLIVILGTLWVVFGQKYSLGSAPEIKRIVSITNAQEQSNELLKLLKRVGPERAQEEMLHSGLPFTGQTHLIIHTIGDYVYDTYGLEGLSYCKDYFLSACYHGFIINALGDHGLEGVAEAVLTCDKQGIHVSAQCAHAAGHGFVAWHDYDLVKGAEMCDQLGEKVKNFYYFNCYDGVFMENIWGVHNGAPSEKRWIKEDDIYYPCNDPRIPEKYIRACWSNQATLIYQHFDGNLKKTAEVCDTVENPNYKETCYNNFARQIHPLTEGNKDKVISYCGNATGQEWREYCMLTIVTSAWSVGDRALPYALCVQAVEPLKNRCFNKLVGLVHSYYAPGRERDMYCNKISSVTHQKQCTKEF